MVQRKCLSVFFSGLFFVGFFSSSAFAFEDLAEMRQVALNNWLQDVRGIVYETKDNAVLELWKKFEKEAVLKIPLDNGGMKELGGANGKMAIVPLLREDMGTEGPWGKLTVSSAAVDFSPEHDGIVIRPSILYGPKAKALAFLPMVYGIFRSQEAPFDWKDNVLFLARQVEMEDFRNRLMMLIGGKGYMGLLKQELFLLALEISRMSGKWELDMVDHLKYSDQLRSIFEEPSGEDEKHFMQASFFTSTVFYFCDRNSVADGKERKQVFVAGLPKPPNRMGF